MEKLDVLDTTLRDGAQGEGIAFSVQDKLNIVRVLDEFGIGFIEAGNPYSNPKEQDFFARARGIRLRGARLCAFGSTCRKGNAPESDPGLAALLGAGTDVVTVFGKAWALHATDILRVTLEENLGLIYDTVNYLNKRGLCVLFDAEHFFDGYRDNGAYAMRVLEAARSGGARVLCLCDTNGGAYPTDIEALTRLARGRFPDADIGIHCHDDTGCAVASTMLAVDAGARHVQGTFIGFGERCGNANLSALLPNLQLKRGYLCVSGGLGGLVNAARTVAEIANVSIHNGMPFVGRSAFAHKGGMHADAVSKVPQSFEHADPALVGNTRSLPISEVSGRAAVLGRLRHVAPGLTKDAPGTAAVLKRLKEMERAGYQFEAADASFELMARKVLGLYTPFFRLIQYKTIGEYPMPDGSAPSTAFIRIEVNGQAETTAAVGDGPVHALDMALRKALRVFYPSLARVRLSDFKVRVLDSGEEATAASVRVLIESTDGKRVWTTVGVSSDIIEACWLALVDSIEYALLGEEGDGGGARAPQPRAAGTASPCARTDPLHPGEDNTL